MAYFVTGGTGFIGRFLVQNLLKRGQPVYALVRKSSQKKLEELQTRFAEVNESSGERMLREEVTAEDIAHAVAEYARSAQLAIEAGFDGVELHAANGYLMEQFLNANVNQRMDAYGGSIENRIRLLREVTAAVIEVAGRERTAVRLSPNGEVQGVNDSQPHDTFPAAARVLAELGIVFLELREPSPDSNFGKLDTTPVAPDIGPV